MGCARGLRAARLTVPGLALLSAGPASGGPQELELAPDRIVLTNGRRAEGRVVFEDAETLVLRVGTRDRIYERPEVRSVDALRDRLPRALEVIDSLPYGSIGLHLEAAATLAELGLARESRLVYWRVLGFDAGEPQAHEALGSRRSGGRWLVPFGKRSAPLEQARARSRDWSEAWEFDTTHFRLRSNLSLEACVRTCFDLERVYLDFYDAFGEGFGLYEVVDTLEVWIHADRRSYPELSGHLGGYFAPAENRLYIDASGGLDRRLLAHEVVHQLLFNTSRRSRKRQGDIPGWLDEGLAQYFQAAVEPAGEGLTFTRGTEVPAWIAQHAGASDPFPLSRVLNFGPSDFRAGESRLKYAQAWSLVQFCLHGREGEYRERFLGFVRECYRGKSSGTHFDAAFGERSEELEREWLAWVRSRAGK